MIFINPTQLTIEGCWAFPLKVFYDERGHFYEWFRQDEFKGVAGEEFLLGQANCSISKRGVLRGIHFAKNPPGQSKFVTCVSGKVLDLIVDFRIGSPTFGEWQTILLDSEHPTAIYIPTGVGHGFMSLEENSTFVYLCDVAYNPKNEFDINPLDKDLAINWPKEIEPILSLKDSKAMSFKDGFKVFPSYK